MRAFPVRLPSGVSYWTVLDSFRRAQHVVGEHSSLLPQIEFGE
jgi:hypothetical protein